MTAATASAPPSSDHIRSLLRSVVDPEIGVNIVDLGLVYGIDAADGAVRISLTMTSPACPMSDVVIADAEAALAAGLPENTGISIDLVWNPPWDPSMMSDKARGTLGW